MLLHDRWQGFVIFYCKSFYYFDVMHGLFVDYDPFISEKTTTYSFTSFTFTVPSHSLLNSGANSINSKMPTQFQKFSVYLGNTPAKKLLNSHHKHLYNRSAMALGYLDIFPRVMIWFFNSWHHLPYINYIVYSKQTWTNEAKKQYFCHWSPCSGFFMFPYYSGRTQYPTLKNLVLKI